MHRTTTIATRLALALSLAFQASALNITFRFDLDDNNFFDNPEALAALEAAAEFYEELIVDETARGLNLGRILVQRTIDDARRRGCAEMGLYLVPTTEGNRGFYEKLGFEVLGTEMRQEFSE